MKTIFYALFVTSLVGVAHAQISPKAVLSSDVILPLEQETYQQLIGYALEVTNTAFELSKPLGKYHCEDIFSMDGYPAVSQYPCEIIVHSDVGPIVVRYKGVDDDTSTLIDTFLTNNALKNQIEYRKPGRFRFSFEEVNEKPENIDLSKPTKK